MVAQAVLMAPVVKVALVAPVVKVALVALVALVAPVVKVAQEHPVVPVAPVDKQPHAPALRASSASNLTMAPARGASLDASPRQRDVRWLTSSMKTARSIVPRRVQRLSAA